MLSLKSIWVVAVVGMLSLPGAAYAQTSPGVEVGVACDQATFRLSSLEGSGPFVLTWTFGDGETLNETVPGDMPTVTAHNYPTAGAYEWALVVRDPTHQAVLAEDGGSLQIGPAVHLASDPFPPLVSLQDGQATITFTAQVEGGEPPYLFEWDLDGDGAADASGDPTSDSAAFTYTSGAKITARVQVTDACGLTTSDSLPVVTIDPAVTCHPMAQRIADAASLLFPDQSTMLYTCEDIYAWFEGEPGEPNLGFGRMWHAIQLAEALSGLTWEEILQWHIDQTGWGTLLQLNRYADALGESSTADWVRLVLSGEADAKDVRDALRTAVTLGVDPDDALTRLASGATAGELKQLYSTAEDLHVVAADLDSLLALGLSLADIRHANRLADRLGGDWITLATEHASGASWGEILDPSGKNANSSETPAQERELERRQEREQEPDPSGSSRETQVEHRLRIAERLAEECDVSAGTILSLFEGACQGDWGCVRAQFREQTGRGKGGKPK